MDSKSALYLIFQLHVLLQTTHGHGNVSVELIRYINRGGRAGNGHCCDGRWGLCQQNGCDYVITTCFTKTNGDIVDDHHLNYRCTEGRFVSRIFWNQNSVNFRPGDVRIDNPIILQYPTAMPENIRVNVHVKDVDVLSKDEHVDSLKFNIKPDQLPVNKKSYQIVKARTWLSISVTKVCSQDWYGSWCHVHCPTEGDATCRQYVCDINTGQRQCTDDCPPKFLAGIRSPELTSWPNVNYTRYVLEDPAGTFWVPVIHKTGYSKTYTRYITTDDYVLGNFVLKQTLPGRFECEATTETVYDSKLYCIMNTLALEYNLVEGTLRYRTLPSAHVLSGQTVTSGSGHMITGHMLHKVASCVSDETGVWIIYPEVEFGRYILSIGKLKLGSLEFSETWETDYDLTKSKDTYVSSFVICGRLYVVEYKEETAEFQIGYQFNTHTDTGSFSNEIKFGKGVYHQNNVMEEVTVRYNIKDQKIYVYLKKQVIAYRLEFTLDEFE